MNVYILEYWCGFVCVSRTFIAKLEEFLNLNCLQFGDR